MSDYISNEVRKKFDFNIRDLYSTKRYNKNFKNINIYGVSTINNPKNQSLIFVKRLSDEIENKLIDIKNSLILIKSDANIKNIILKNNECLFVENPRLEYARILTFILSKQDKKTRKYQSYDNYVIIGENTEIGENTKIEPFVFIDHDVKIGNDCIISTGARIINNVSIGNNVIIGQNTIIGGIGAAAEKDSDGELITIPHIGGVLIGNSVEIGALVTVQSGIIEPTTIEDNVLIANHVSIAHNGYIKSGCILTGSSVLGGSVEVDKNSWLGLNCTIKNGIKIGKNVLVGMGAVVRKSTKDNVIVAGDAAKEIPKFKKF